MEAALQFTKATVFGHLRKDQLIRAECKPFKVKKTDGPYGPQLGPGWARETEGGGVGS